MFQTYSTDSKNGNNTVKLLYFCTVGPCINTFIVRTLKLYLLSDSFVQQTLHFKDTIWTQKSILILHK